MSLSIIPLGGYGEVGRNATAVEVDGDIFIFDLGLHIENYTKLSDDDYISHKLSKRLLIKEQAVPDISVIDAKKVKGVLISHAHLDHVGAVPYLANSFDCDIHGTPFTMEIARRLILDKKMEMKNTLVSHEYKEKFQLTDDVAVEFIEVTHSTPHSAAIALHTPYGVVLYLNDFKLDDEPFIGNKTDLERFKELDVKALIIDTLYADIDARTPGEKHAKELLEAALLSRDLSDKNIVATTFSSQISRLITLAEIGKKMGRKVMFIGRSMSKYLEAAKDVGITDLIDQNDSIRFGSKVRKGLSKVYSSKDYLFITTGGMAEPKAVLSRIVDEELLPLKRGDIILFSNRVIPVPHIIEVRERLERQLQSVGFELLKDLHVSGHGAGKDHEIILDTVKPKILVPVHGEEHQRIAFKRLAMKKGFDESSILVLENAQKHKL